MVSPFSRATVSTNFLLRLAHAGSNVAAAVPFRGNSAAGRSLTPHPCSLPSRLRAASRPAPEPRDRTGVGARLVRLRRGRGPGEEARQPALQGRPPIGGEMKKLGYDHYRALRSKPDTALWHDKGLFRVEFFPAGFIYDTPVHDRRRRRRQCHAGRDRQRPVRLQDTGLKDAAQGPRAGGFQGHLSAQRPDKFDEVIAFLGASYFRPIGRGQIYGSSARGLAIDTATEPARGIPGLPRLLAGQARARAHAS